MKLSRPHASVFVALLLLSGCAHKTATTEPQADGTLVSAAAPAEMSAPTDAVRAEDMPLEGMTSEGMTSGGMTSSAAMPAADGVQSSTASSRRQPPAEPAPAVAASGGDGRTEAERDFAALYGQQEEIYDPIADPTLPPPAEQALSYDPWEKFNRRVHGFNNAIDRRIAKPLATAYVKVVPRPVRLGVGNFFNNLGQPVSAVNALLQGKPKQAANSAGRFLLNTTVGVAGIFDPATAAKIPNKSEDFGQTLGVWGWKKSRYVELPLFGPRTMRDIFGLVGDSQLSPIRRVEDDRIRVFLQGLQLVDLRAQLMSTDSFREGAADDYTLVRDAWMQRRQYQINADKPREGDEALPDYLKDEDNPTVPIDAMPSPDIN
jgi:phospholipid-binding lipoprotein MlaA